MAGFLLALIALFSPTAADPAAAYDTENCATHEEYDRVDVFMLPVTVAEILDVYGQYVDTPNPDTFARTYRTCWAPETREIIVRYDSDSRLSFDKDIRDK
jgi:hypothetical protein